jgi:hypothetical protein
MSRTAFLLCWVCLSTYPLTAQFQLNEIMSWNTLTEAGQGYAGYPDWIEIQTTSSQLQSLDGWSLSDDPEQAQKWFLPENRVVKPGHLVMVYADGFDHGFHASFELRSEGEWLGLYRPDGSLADSLSLPHIGRNHSYGRDPETGAWSWFQQPTPGENNLTPAYSQVTAKPQFSHPAGSYEQGFSLTITHPAAEAVIRYTTDGSDPDSTSQRYQGPLSWSSTGVLKVRAWVEGQVPSPVVVNTYLIAELITDLPVLSLTTPPANLWDDQIGIYVTGTNGTKGNGPESDPPRNWNQDWERRAFLEYFDAALNRQLRQEAGIKIFGGWSRGMPQKSLAVFARKEYGSNRFRYPFFSTRPFPEYKSFLLRNSGNDFVTTGGAMLRDGYQQLLTEHYMAVDGQAYQPSVVFLNGEYWGIHNQREKLNEAYLQAHHQVNPKELDLLGWHSEIFNGSNQRYLDLFDHIGRKSLGQASNMERVYQEMDLVEFIDYQIIQIYINNQDWPGNNIKFWRAHAPGSRWRWLLYDTDFGFGIWDFRVSDNTVAFALEPNGPGWPNPPWSTQMLRRLITNPDFKRQFNQRFLSHLNFTFHPDRTGGILDSLSTQLEPNMQRHLWRWGGPGIWEWVSRVGSMQSFARYRPQYVRDHLRGQFGLGEVVTVQLNQPDSLWGTVRENGFLLPLQYTGQYLERLAIPFEARPQPGYGFSHWAVYDQAPEVSERQAIAWHGGRVWNQPPGQDLWVEAYFEPLDLMFAELYLPDTTTNLPAYIDLYNPGPEPVMVGGYKITGALETVLPSALSIGKDQVLRLTAEPDSFPAYQSLKLDLDSLDIRSLGLSLHHPAGFQIDTLQTDTLSWPEGRHLRLRHPQLSNAFGANWESLPEVSPFTFAPLRGRILINELMSDSRRGILDEQGRAEDWLELYNPNPFAVDVGGWFLSDDPEEPLRFQIPSHVPAQTTIAPGTWLRFWADGDTLDGPLHLPFRLDKAGETLILSEPGGWEADRVALPASYADESFGRYPDGRENWQWVPLVSTTPGGKNVPDNVPPAFTSGPREEIRPENYYRYDIQTQDENGDYRWLEALAVPQWLRFESYFDGNGALFGTPQKQHIGTHLVQLRIWDGYQGSQSVQTFSIEVIDPALADLQDRMPYDGILSPNPSAGEMDYLVRAEADQPLQMSLKDVAGRTVWEKEEQTTEDIFRTKLDFSHLASGLYFFQLWVGEEPKDLHKVVLQR